MADVVAIGLRAAAAAAVLLAAGRSIFLYLYGHLLNASERRVRSTVLPTALAALALVTLHALVEPVRLAGSWSGLLDPALHALLLSSDFGTTIAVRVLGLTLIAVSSWSPGRNGTVSALTGATLVAVSFAFMGHTAADPRRWLLAPLLFIHLLAIAYWFGSLRPLLTVTRFESADTAGNVIRQFSRTALVIVPFVLIAGLAMSGVLLPGLDGLATPYGLSLLMKIGGFSLLMALAGLNKWRLAPAVAQGERSGVLAFRISVLTEWILILAVVTITAVMTALFSPDH